MTDASPRHARRYMAATLLVLVAALVSACAEDAPSGDDVGGLVVLSGDVGETRLTTFTGADGTPVRIEAPSPATSWISAGPDGRLLATLADGRLGLHEASGDGWRMFEPDAASSAGSMLFGAISPNGTRAAALTLGSAGQFGVAITDLSDGRTATFPIDGSPVLTSPAWIDEERVGIVATDEATGGAVSVADTSSGDVTGGPGDVQAVAVSGNGQVIAWIAASDGVLRGTAASGWLAGDASAGLPIAAPSGGRAGSFALDGNGGRIAVVWERDDGTVIRIEVLRRTADGWTAAGRLDAPGGDPRAVVSWLR